MDGSTPKAVRYHAQPRRSGRVAEGGALLRRYVGEYLHRGFESLLLRWRGGRAVECGGLENRYPSLGGSRVQIPPPPLPGPFSRVAERPGALPRRASRSPLQTAREGRALARTSPHEVSSIERDTSGEMEESATMLEPRFVNARTVAQVLGVCAEARSLSS